MSRKGFQEYANGVLLLKRVPQWKSRHNRVAILSSRFLDTDETSCIQLTDDPHHRSFRDPNKLSYVTNSDVWLLPDGQQDVRVVREKCPTGCGFLSQGFNVNLNTCLSIHEEYCMYYVSVNGLSK